LADFREKPMSIDEDRIAHFRERLKRLERELLELEEVGAETGGTVELDQTRQGRLSRMDALQGQAMSQELARRRQAELGKIRAALRRIAEGEYGYCVQCGGDIAERRLEYDPAAALCIACAGKAEREGR
jgi:DnaK suppressor protein